jgi:hypothetical protein
LIGYLNIALDAVADYSDAVYKTAAQKPWCAKAFSSE